MPALPQQISCSANGSDLDAGDRSQQIARRLADALRVREVAGVVVRDAQRERMARRPRRRRARETISVTSRTRAENARARSAHAGSSASSCPYSFIDDPQPAALTAIRSTPARSNTSIVRRAKARASSSRPACSASAPQQPCSGGATTSQPSAASTLTVAVVDAREHEALHAAGQQADRQARACRRPASAPGRRKTASAQRHVGASDSIARSASQRSRWSIAATFGVATRCVRTSGSELDRVRLRAASRVSAVRFRSAACQHRQRHQRDAQAVRDTETARRSRRGTGDRPSDRG